MSILPAAGARRADKDGRGPDIPNVPCIHRCTGITLDYPLLSLFDQFHSPVFGLAIRRVVRCDRRKGRHAIGI